MLVNQKSELTLPVYNKNNNVFICDHKNNIIEGVNNILKYIDEKKNVTSKINLDIMNIIPPSFEYVLIDEICKRDIPISIKKLY